MKKLAALLVLLTFITTSACEHSLCFVHIGSKAPDYLEHSVKQARLFNDDCPIYVGLSKSLHEEFEQSFAGYNITLVGLDDLPRSPEHEEFIVQSQVRKQHRGLWLYSKQRFLYLYDIAKEYNLKHIFHLENDNMLYTDLKELLPVLKEYYPAVAATFDNDDRAIAGFMYFADTNALQDVAQYIADKATTQTTDMGLFPLYKREKNDALHLLPICMKEYADEHELISPKKHKANHPSDYYNNYELFGSIFDAAAIGQYLGGTHKRPVPGFVNESCVVRPSRFEYTWEKDEQGRRVPFTLFNDKKYRINNLHIHSKELYKFSSLID